MLAVPRSADFQGKIGRFLEPACILRGRRVDFRQLGICGRLQPKLLKSQNVANKKIGDNNLRACKPHLPRVSAAFFVPGLTPDP